MKSNGLLPLRLWLLTALLAVALVGIHQTAKAAVTFQTAASGLGTNGGPVGLDWLIPSNQLLTSVNFPSGETHNFEVVNSGISVSHAQYSTEHGKTFEIHLATVRETSGGFTVGDTFYGSSGTGTGTPLTGIPQILRIPSGGGAPVVFATLPAIELGQDIYPYKDMTGLFGGNLLVSSASGHIYLINSAGVVAPLTTIAPLPNTNAADPILEGTITVPNNPKYGIWAGKAVVASERNHGFYAVTPAGVPTFTPITGISLPEDLRIVPCGQNLYIADFRDNSILGVSAADLAPLVDHFVVVEEIAFGTSNVWDVVPNGTGFTKTLLSVVNQAEQITFSPIGVGPIPAGTPAAQICGVVFIDKNCNGKLNNGDVGIKGVPVVLKDANGNVVAKTTTGAGGVYCFTNLSAGVYNVSVPKFLETTEFRKDKRDEDDDNKHDGDGNYYHQKGDDNGDKDKDNKDKDERELRVDTPDPLKVVIQACEDSENNNFGFCRKADDKDKDKDKGDDNGDNGDDNGGHGDGGDD